MINIIQNTIGSLRRSGGGGDTTSFITTWRTTTASETITIPTTGTGYNYAISTSDGQSFSGVTGSQAIIFTSAGDYDVSISGDFPRIYFNNAGDKAKIIDIKQWGNIAWSSFEKSFYGCSNLVGTVTDTPDLSGVTNLSTSFRDCTLFNGDLSSWGVSTITDTSLMLFSAKAFNSDISSWNVSSITTMRYMLYQAESFNQNINSWDVSSVLSMDNMLARTYVFDYSLEDWDISGVTNLFRLLHNCTLSVVNYDSILIGWEATLQAAYPSGTGYTPTITISFGNSEYTGGGAVATARASLISNFGWTITDGGIA